jgi:hypothetical protein
MTSTSISTSTEAKLDTDDGVVPNETLVIDPVPSLVQGGEEKTWSGDPPAGPTEVVLKDPDPVDGGYGWVVVGYSPFCCFVLIVVLFVC